MSTPDAARHRHGGDTGGAQTRTARISTVTVGVAGAFGHTTEAVDSKNKDVSNER